MHPLVERWLGMKAMLWWTAMHFAHIFITRQFESTRLVRQLRAGKGNEKAPSYEVKVVMRRVPWRLGPLTPHSRSDNVLLAARLQ